MELGTKAPDFEVEAPTSLSAPQPEMLIMQRTAESPSTR